MIRTKPILVKQKDIRQLGLGSIFKSAIFLHISSCNTCNHSTIENFHILSHGNNDFDNKARGLVHQETKTSLR